VSVGKRGAAMLRLLRWRSAEGRHSIVQDALGATRGDSVVYQEMSGGIRTCVTVPRPFLSPRRDCVWLLLQSDLAGTTATPPPAQPLASPPVHSGRRQSWTARSGAPTSENDWPRTIVCERGSRALRRMEAGSRSSV